VKVCDKPKEEKLKLNYTKKMYSPEKLYSYRKHKKLINTISSVGTPAE
jgi:hypothetical protein